MSIENDIENIISLELSQLNRLDLFREPLVGFSSADNPEYQNLKTVIGEWHCTPKEIYAQADSVISYFVPFTKEVAVAPQKANAESAVWGEAYAVMNKHFERINGAVCNYLTRVGYSAMPLAATHNFDTKTLRAKWSHRSAAVISGLGSFAANHMVITEKGSAGRFCTIFTSAKLKVSSDTSQKICLYLKNGSCKLCFLACKIKALTPNSFDKFACQAETQRTKRALEESIGLLDADVCGSCVSACPLSYIP